mmetsp:Transcript_33748/g.86264  ORF Transcript_33748/g.86264 Transcript_33748/m.86264 type:complete len:1685 (+) Transcript_33748:275-5329(+)
MESRGKLQALLAELEHRSSSVQRCSSDSSAGDESLSLRMRHVLHLLFQDYGTGGKAEAVGEDAPLNILKIMLSLLCLALDKFPGVFHDNGISSIPYFFARVMQLVSLPKLRPHSKKLVDTLDRLATQCLAQDTETCAIIYTDLAVLVQDVDMAFSGMLDSMPQDKCVTLQSFNHCFAKMSGGGDCMDSSRGHIYGQLQCITLTLESETAALDVTAATARLLSRILLESPSFAHCMPGIALLRPLHALFPYGSDEHQAAMMQAIHAEAAVLCPREISARQLLCTVLDMLEGIATSRHQKIMSGGLSQACVHCLELSVCKLTQTEWGALHVYAPRLLQALSHLAVHSTDKGVQVSLLSILVVLMECQPSLQLPALRIAGAMISAAVESGVVVDHFQQPFAHILNCRTATRSSGQGSAYSATGTLHVPAEVGEELLAMPRRCCPATGNVPDDRCLQKMYALQMLIASATPHKLFEEFYDVCLETASLWTGWMMNLSEDLRSAEGVSCLLQLLESLATLLLCQQFSGSQPQHAAAKYQGLKLGEMLELPWSKLSKRDDGCPAEEMQLHQSRWTLDSARRSSLRTSYLHQAISHKCQHQRGAWDSAATSMRIVRKSLADSSPDVRALAVAALPFVFYMEPSRAKPAAHTERSSAAQCLQELSGAVGDEALIVRREVGKSLQVMIKSTLPGTRWELQFADAYYSMCRNYGVEVLALRCSEILLNSAEAVSSCKSNINAATSFPSSFALDQSALQPFMVLITDKNERPEVQCSMLDFMGTWLHAQQDALTVTKTASVIKKCVNLVTSPSRQLRSAVVALLPAIAAPAKVIHIYKPDTSVASAVNVKDSEVLLLKDLRGKLEASKHNDSSDVQESVMACIAQLAISTQTREALWMSVVLLVDVLDDERQHVRVIAAELLHSVARQRGVKVAELITGQSRVMEYVGRRLGSKPQLLPELADMLEIQSSEIAQKLVPSVLPRLVISQDMQLLGALAKCLQQSLKDMLVNYGHHTVAFLLLEGQQDIDEYAAFMLRHTEVEFDDLMKSSLRSVLKEVIWCAGEYKRWSFSEASDGGDTNAGLQPSAELIETVQNNVLGCILRIHTGKDISEDDISAAVADFLHEEQMIWLLTELVGDRMKRGKEAELAEQLQALRCLSLLIVFVGRHLADFVPLMMTLLARATELSAPDVQLQALAAWSLFIKQLSTRAPQMLRIHAVRIAVILTAFLDSGGNATLAASAAMEELVISNRANLDEQCLCEFPPLPSLPSLEAVNRALVQARGDLSAPDHLLMLAEGLVPHRPRQYTGQPLAVKAVTMMEIKCFLQQHQEWRLSLAARQKQIPGADPWHHALDFLVAVLLKSCDPEVRSALSHRVHLRGAECLGSVGAVDPAKLSKVETFKILISKAQSADQICESEAELAKQVLSSLANLLSGSSDLEISEAATFGIQELLAQFNDSTGAGESGDSLYRSIEPELQAVVRPYLSTKYQLQSSAPGTIKSPIFGPHTLSFRRWLFLWLKQLTDLMGPERATIFKACTGVARHDISIMLLLLPHAVLNVLASGDEAAAPAVLMEIHTVLKGCTETGNMQTDWHLLLQALFTLFDKLKTWVLRVDNQGTISSGNNSGKRAAISSGHFSEGKACVEKMLQEVDHRVLAKASYRCLPVQKGHALIVSSISTKNPRSGFKVWSVRTGDAIL